MRGVYRKPLQCIDENAARLTASTDAEEDELHSLRYRNRRLAKELAAARRVAKEMEHSVTSAVSAWRKRAGVIERAAEDRFAAARRDLDRLEVLCELKRRLVRGGADGSAAHDERFTAAFAEAVALMRSSLDGEPEQPAELALTVVSDDTKRDLSNGMMLDIVDDLRCANAKLRRELADSNAALQLIPRYKVAVLKARDHIGELKAQLAEARRESACFRERIEELESAAPPSARRQGELVV
jgi:hypothetical protein